MANEIFNLSAKRENFSSCVVHVVRRMSQCAAAIVGPVKRQIIRAKKVVAVAIDHVVAVAVYRQTSPVEGILLSQREGQIRADRESDVQCACGEGSLDSARKFQMKVIRERECLGETKIDGPTAIYEICALAALKPHSALTL